MDIGQTPRPRVAEKFGAVHIGISTAFRKNETRAGAKVSDVDSLSLGVDWKWHPKNTATLAYYHNQDDLNRNDETDNIVISNDYAVRPDTTFYVQMAHIDAGSAATIKTSIVAAGIPAVGEAATLLNVGINFRF